MNRLNLLERNLIRALCVMALALTLFLPEASRAQQTTVDPEQLLKEATAHAERADAALERLWLDDDTLDELRGGVEDHRKDLGEVILQATEDLAPLRAELEALGPAPDDPAAEAADVTAQRERLAAQISTVESLLKRGQQALARADALSDRLSRERRERFARNLTRLGPSPLKPERISGAWNSVRWQIEKIAAETSERVAALPVGSTLERIGLPMVLALLALILGVGVRQFSVKWLLKTVSDEATSARLFAVGVGVTLARLLVPALALGLIYVGLTNAGILGPTGETLLRGIIIAIAVVVGTYALGGAFFAPNAPHLRMSTLDDERAVGAQRWLVVLAVVVGFDWLLVQTGRDIGINISAMTVLNAGLLSLGGIALWSFIRVAKLGAPIESTAASDVEDDTDPEPPALWERARHMLRIVALSLAVIAPVLALIGYFGASRFAFYPSVFSGAFISFCVLIYNVAKAGTLTVKRSRQQDATDVSAGVLPVFAGFLLCVVAVPVLAMIWGADQTDIWAAWTRTLEGFNVGSTRISPVDFVLFAIVFVIGYILTKLLQGVLRRTVLPLTRLDTGAQSALLAGVGYVGVVVSALIAVSTTGLDLSNIAIVAGALSVGIGFGLQNIVNNFVSGIILLIERPIKTGDWVEISGVHGTVQQVNVRSTEIQTFDRSTMFVPNADLISGTVTNWTHGNSQGRIIVKIGIAYGTDARKAEKILLEIARAHPMLLRRPEPYVVFAGFGDSSLDFEIRGVLRDVNWILSVASDLRFSIYERFTDEGIEIPFAQSEITIRNLSELRGDLPPSESQSGA